MVNNRIEYISLVSVVAIIGVILLHANDCFWNFSTSEYWVTANIFNSVFYFAVPLFFMISGALLLDFNKRYGLKVFFKKRIVKTFIPFIAWSFLGLIIQTFYFQKMDINSIDLTFLANGLLNGNLINVYWFFIPLFCMYLIIPIFACIDDKNKKNILIYAATAIFILDILIPFLMPIFNLPLNFSIHFSISGGSLFLVLVGYLLHKYELSMKLRILLYSTALIGLFIILFGTYYLSMAANEVVVTYKGFFNLPSILYSMGVFVFIKYDLVKIMKFKSIRDAVNYLDYYTFGVYLIHWYVFEFILKFFNVSNQDLIFRFLSPIVVLLVSVRLVYLLRKLPLIKNIVP